MTATSIDRPSGSATLPWLVSGFGALSFGFFLGWSAWFAASLNAVAVVMGTVTIAVPALGLVWGGYRLERSDIDAARYDRIVQWCFAGGGGFLAINVLAIVLYPWYNLAGNIAWAHFSVNAGAVAGFAIGYVEAQAVQREVEATATAVRAERLEDEREVLTYLNDLLRHEVLNSAQIIGGHASLLLEDAEGQRRDHLETIEGESDALTDVIDDVRAMLNANREPETAVDVGAVLTEELAAVERRVDDVEIDAEIPESVFVEGNDGLTWIFSNLLENAVEHNDCDDLRIEVAVETTDETVRVRIEDNGSGIPDKTRETLFERNSENHGLGLYLVRILAGRYDGSVELAETGPNGSAFTVTLPRIDPHRTDDVAVESVPDERTADDAESEAATSRASNGAAGTKRSPVDAERPFDSSAEQRDPSADPSS